MDFLKNYIQLFRNMGPRYVAQRVWHEAARRTGFLKRRFPTAPRFREFITREEWKALPVTFFPFPPHIQLPKEKLSTLEARVRNFRQGRLTFFSSKEYPVADWLTNPATGYRYDGRKHWTDIPDFSPEAGDIKYVWEKSRFAFLYDLIRYDFHFQHDQAKLVFDEIESWIEANPVNRGPNWRCSQEIALRVLNWTFALQYYKNSPLLTDERLARILHSVYWQMRHVAAHIHFSRRVVRNNHALTETLALYLAGMLYPFFPESTLWKKNGKRWFEQEIAYQIYEDGTFLQFSMNYHRVVVQLLSWGIRLAHLNQESWAPVVYDRARKSLQFLRTCQDETTGWLPNYGNNDGALFFPLTECHFRDYRPQLTALARVVSNEVPDEDRSVSGRAEFREEEAAWLGMSSSKAGSGPMPDGTFSFEKSGYYVLRDTETVTFLRCGHYRDRPFQADNLHLDIWVQGENILRDAGSYLYNTDEHWTRYFAGTASHNTVMLGDYDQMRKGPRFIWYDWIQKSTASWLTNDQNEYVFEGEFTGFRQAGTSVRHRRRVTKPAGKLHWVVEDWLEDAPPALAMHQLWHPGDGFFKKYHIRSFDQKNSEIVPTETEGWYSEKYGQKVPALRLVFSTQETYLKTEIVSVKN